MDTLDSTLKLPVSAINFIFSQISTMDDKVSWIRSPDYEQQLYVSPSYEKIWGINPYKLYEHPLSWNETLVNTDIITNLKNRGPNNNTTAYFQILDARKKIKYMKDTCFHLCDRAGKIIAVAGVSENIPEAQWDDANKINHPINKITDPLQNILHQIAKQSSVTPTTVHTLKQLVNAEGKVIKLTPREQACLQHLLKGNTAKQIARILLISPRTVEVHIENMKLKLGCRTRIELISKLNNYLLGN